MTGTGGIVDDNAEAADLIIEQKKTDKLRDDIPDRNIKIPTEDYLIRKIGIFGDKSTGRCQDNDSASVKYPSEMSKELEFTETEMETVQIYGTKHGELPAGEIPDEIADLVIDLEKDNPVAIMNAASDIEMPLINIEGRKTQKNQDGEKPAGQHQESPENPDKATPMVQDGETPMVLGVGTMLVPDVQTTEVSDVDTTVVQDVEITDFEIYNDPAINKDATIMKTTGKTTTPSSGAKPSCMSIKHLKNSDAEVKSKCSIDTWKSGDSAEGSSPSKKIENWKSSVINKELERDYKLKVPCFVALQKLARGRDMLLGLKKALKFENPSGFEKRAEKLERLITSSRPDKLRLVIYPITFDDYNHPIILEAASKCYSLNSVHHNIAEDIETEPVIIGLLHLHFKKEADLLTYGTKLKSVKDNIEVYQVSQSSDLIRSFNKIYLPSFLTKPAVVLRGSLPSHVGEDDLWEIFPKAHRVCILESDDEARLGARNGNIMFASNDALQKNLNWLDFHERRRDLSTLEFYNFTEVAKELKRREQRANDKGTKVEDSLSKKKENVQKTMLVTTQMSDRPLKESKKQKRQADLKGTKEEKTQPKKKESAQKTMSAGMTKQIKKELVFTDANVKPMTLLSKPEIADLTEESLTLRWKASFMPSYAEQTPIWYIVEQRELPNPDWMEIANDTKTELTAVRITSEKDYHWRIRAANKYGVTEPSRVAVLGKDQAGMTKQIEKEVDYKKAKLKPRIILDKPEIADLTEVSLTIRWKASSMPTYAEQTPIWYIVEQWEPSDSDWVEITKVTKTELRGVRITRETDYHWRIRAVNKYGVTEPSSVTLLKKRIQVTCDSAEIIPARNKKHPHYRKEFRELYITSITPSFDESEFKEWVTKTLMQLGHSDVENPIIGIQHKKHKVKRDFLFVEFRTEDLATKALELDGHIFQRAALDVMRPRKYAMRVKWYASQDSISTNEVKSNVNQVKTLPDPSKCVYDAASEYHQKENWTPIEPKDLGYPNKDGRIQDRAPLKRPIESDTIERPTDAKKRKVDTEAKRQQIWSGAGQGAGEGMQSGRGGMQSRGYPSGDPAAVGMLQGRGGPGAGTGGEQFSRSSSKDGISIASRSRSRSEDKSGKQKKAVSPEVSEDDMRGVIIRGLNIRSSESSIRDGLFYEFKKYGTVMSVNIIENGDEPRHAVVSYQTNANAKRAMESTDGKHFLGSRIAVSLHQGFNTDDSPSPKLDNYHYKSSILKQDEYSYKATRTLYIGNLEKDVENESLREMFSRFGFIIDIDKKCQGMLGHYAFVQYDNIKSVVQAIQEMDGQVIGLSKVKLGFAKSMPTCCVWMDNVSENVSNSYLCKKFSQFGPVIYEVIDRESNNALVYYDALDSAKRAVNEMRGVDLGGRKLQTDFASAGCQTLIFNNLERQGLIQPEEHPDRNPIAQVASHLNSARDSYGRTERSRSPDSHGFENYRHTDGVRDSKDYHRILSPRDSYGRTERSRSPDSHSFENYRHSDGDRVSKDYHRRVDRSRSPVPKSHEDCILRDWDRSFERTEPVTNFDEVTSLQGESSLVPAGAKSLQILSMIARSSLGIRKSERNNVSPLSEISPEERSERRSPDMFTRSSVEMRNLRSDISPPRERSRSDISPQRERSRRSDISPPRERSRSDISPPREWSRSDISPPRERSRSDISPQRERSRRNDISPPRERSRSNISPPREWSRSDISPQRERSRRNDISPPRERSRSDISPPREWSRRNDISPPRERSRSNISSPREWSRRNDISPPRERSRSNISPPREWSRNDISPPRERSRSNISPPREWSRRNDISPPRERSRSNISPPREWPRSNISPPREWSRSNISPPKEWSRRNDISPTRERSRSDISPPRERSRSDISPLREQSRRNDISPPREWPRSNISPPKEWSRRNDISPPREQSRSDISPPREQSRSDISPPREWSRNDISPPREWSRNDISPPRERSRRSDISPPRERSRRSDISPPKERSRRSDIPPLREKLGSDISPLRERSRRSDISPPSERLRRSDISPTRERSRRSDIFPPRERSRSDNSPPRELLRRNDISPPRERSRNDISPPREWSRSDISPPRERSRSNNISPPRERSTSDISPPRERSRRSDISPPREWSRRSDIPPLREKLGSDISPLRERSRRSDISPPSERLRRSDISPTRERSRRSDIFPPRERSRSDNSPPRELLRRRDISPPREQLRRSDISPARERSRRSDISPPRERSRRSDISPPRERSIRSDVSPPRQRLPYESYPQCLSDETYPRGSELIDHLVPSHHDSGLLLRDDHPVQDLGSGQPYRDDRLIPARRESESERYRSFCHKKSKSPDHQESYLESESDLLEQFRFLQDSLRSLSSKIPKSHRNKVDELTDFGQESRDLDDISD